METCANRAEEGRVVSTRWWKMIAFLFFFFFSFRKIATIELSISRKGRKEGINAIGLVRGTKKIVRCGVERRLNGLDRLRSGTD